MDIISKRTNQSRLRSCIMLLNRTESERLWIELVDLTRQSKRPLQRLDKGDIVQNRNSPT